MRARVCHRYYPNPDPKHRLELQHLFLKPKPCQHQPNPYIQDTEGRPATARSQQAITHLTRKRIHQTNPKPCLSGNPTATSLRARACSLAAASSRTRLSVSWLQTKSSNIWAGRRRRKIASDCRRCTWWIGGRSERWLGISTRQRTLRTRKITMSVSSITTRLHSKSSGKARSIGREPVVEPLITTPDRAASRRDPFENTGKGRSGNIEPGRKTCTGKLARLSRGPLVSREQ
jgi:hypothetical protein